MKEQKLAMFSQFRGVDLSSSPFEVASNRFVDMNNFMLKNGVLRKRNGYQQVDYFPDGVNGVWQIEIDDADYTIVHSKDKIYRSELDETTGMYTHTDLTGELTIQDVRSFGSIKNNRLYIACGNYLVFGKWTSVELREVYNDEDTYIPTTTISIDHDDAVDLNRYVLEDVNLLSSRRKNTLVGVDCTVAKTYTVDSAEIKSGSKVTVTGTILGGTSVSYVNSADGETFGTTLYNGAAVVGSVAFSTGKITFDGVNLSPLVADDANLTVEFDANATSSLIQGCTFGSVFGVSQDRLFLSGNPNYKNMDWYSESNDYTYFPEMNYTVFGSSLSPVSAYLIMSDGIQAILKSNEQNEPSIYFRTIDTQQVLFDVYESGAYVGQKVIGYKDVFPIKAGLSGLRLASPYACSVLNNDNLVLLKNGVHAVRLLENVATDERIVVQRSKPILQALMDNELSSSVGFSYDNKYYLALGNNIYVADGSQWYDSQNYEWFIYKNIDVKMFFLLDSKLFFADNTGRVYQMETDRYSDRTYVYGGLTATDDNVFTAALSYDVEEGNEMVIVSATKFYQLYIESTVDNPLSLTDNGIYANGQRLNDCEVYIDGVGDTGLLIDKAYSLVFDNEHLTFKLYDGESEAAVAGDVTTLKILRVINNRSFTVGEVTTDTAHTFKIYENGVEVDVYESANYTLPVTAKEVYFYTNTTVNSYLYGKITDLEAPYIAKNLLALYCTPDQLPYGELTFGYRTYRSSEAFSVVNAGTFRFSDLVFSEFKFSSVDFPSGFKKNIIDRDKHYIQFKVESTTARDCGINNFGVKYTLNREIKGVE